MSDQDLNTNTPADDEMHPVAKTVFGWVEHPRAGQIIFWTIAVLAVVLILADAVVHRHTKEDIEKIFGAYGWYGFLAFASVVLAGWPLGQLLRRPESYYAEDAPDDDQEASL